MCYQTRLIKKREEIAERFNAELEDLNSYEPFEIGNGFDFSKMPIITNTLPNKVQFYNWGLIPSWSENNAIRNYTLNARIETLDEKKSFKDSIQNRCLIIADGFYEWQWKTKSGSKKEKYLITKPNEDLFAFAGIYTHWINFDDTIINTFSIITTQANELMSKIHNTKKRMPVILKKEDEEKWLHGVNYNQFALPYSVNLVATSLNNRNLEQLNLFS